MVSELGSGHISTYTPSGKKVHLNGLNPHGLVLDREGNIIVGENRNFSIRKYSQEGQLLASVNDTGQLQFTWPRDIAVNTTNNKVYVAGCVNCCNVQVLNSDLTIKCL